MTITCNSVIYPIRLAAHYTKAPRAMEPSKTKVESRYPKQANTMVAIFRSLVNARSDFRQNMMVMSEKIRHANTKAKSVFPAAATDDLPSMLRRTADPKDNDRNAISMGKLKSALKKSTAFTSCSISILDTNLSNMTVPGNAKSASICGFSPPLCREASRVLFAL